MRHATCHPDRKHYSLGLCQACYERKRFSTPDARKHRRAVERKWYDDHRTQVILWNQEYYYDKLYGLDVAAVNALKAKQGNRCALCGRLVRILCVDHDHNAGEIRGLLCTKCNMLLGQLEKLGIAKIQDYLLQRLGLMVRQ